MAEPGGQRLVGGAVHPVAQRRPREVAVAACDIHLQPGSPGERDAVLELRCPGEIPAEQLHRAHRVERVHADLEPVDAVGQLERARAPRQRPVGVLAVHAQAGHVGVGQSELAAALELLEHGHGVAPEPLGLCAAIAGAEEHVGEPPHPVALAQPIAERAMARERLAHRLDRLAAVVGAEGRPEAALEQRDPLLLRQIGAEAQRAGVLGRRLAVRADRLGARGGGRGELEHGGRVAGGLGGGARASPRSSSARAHGGRRRRRSSTSACPSPGTRPGRPAATRRRAPRAARARPAAARRTPPPAGPRPPRSRAPCGRAPRRARSAGSRGRRRPGPRR